MSVLGRVVDRDSRVASDFALPAREAAGAATLFGIPVRFDLSCAFATALGAWTFADVVLPAVAPGRSALAYWTGGVAAALLALMSIVAHELGHALAARRAGIGIRRMALSLFGGLTELVESPRSPGVAFRIAVAGPVASGVLAIVAAATHVILVEADADPIAAVIPALAAVANLAIAAINLLPGLPLDGGYALAAALWRVTGRATDGARVAAALGRVVGFVLIGLAVLGSASGDAGLALWIALFGIVIWHGAGRASAASRTPALDRLRGRLRLSRRPPARAA